MTLRKPGVISELDKASSLSEGCSQRRNLKKNPPYLQGTAVAQWLRCCATNRKVAGSIPACVIGIFH